MKATSRRMVLLGAPAALAGCAAARPRLLPPVAAPGGPVPPPDLFLAGHDGAPLPARAWLPPEGREVRGAVLALHGFNDSRDAWEMPGPPLAAAGYAVYAPDQRGFGAAPGRGAWPGTDALVADARAMCADVAGRHPGARRFLVGESMGGAVALLAVTRRPGAPVLDGTALLAPAVWGRAQMTVLMTTGLWLAAAVAPGWELTGREVEIKVRASDNRDALLRLARDPLTIRRTRVDALAGLVDLMGAAQAAAPRLGDGVLLMYGARDEIVPDDAKAAAWRHLSPAVRRAIYPEGYHLLLRDVHRAAPTGDLIRWLDEPGAALPSGADIAAATWGVAHTWTGASSRPLASGTVSR